MLYYAAKRHQRQIRRERQKLINRTSRDLSPEQLVPTDRDIFGEALIGYMNLKGIKRMEINKESRPMKMIFHAGPPIYVGGMTSRKLINTGS